MLNRYFGARCLVIAMCFTLFSCRDDGTREARDLMDAFSTGCSSSNRWTQIAIDHNAKLKKIVESLRDTDPCKAVKSELSTIVGYSDRVQGFLENADLAPYRTAEAKVRELTLVYADTPDTPDNADLRSALAAGLADAQIELATTRATERSSQRTHERERYSAAAKDLGAMMTNLMNDTPALVACLKESPVGAVQIATNLAAIGGSLVSPVAGAAASTIGQLLNVAVNAIKQSRDDDALWELNANLMPTALTCGLESMSEFYCDSSDYKTLLHAEEDIYADPNNPHPIWQAFDILARRMPVLNDWLAAVENGADPQRPSIADERALVQFRRTAVKTEDYTIKALLNQTERSLTPANHEAKLISVISSTAQDLSGSSETPSSGSSGHSSSSPFTVLSTSRHTYACYLILGVETGGTKCPTFMPNPQEPVGDFIRRTPDLKNTLLDDQKGGIALIRANWRTILGKAQSIVDAEYAAVINDDPARILDLATLPAQDMMTPEQSLLKIIAYLKDLQQRFSGEPSFIADTIAMLEGAVAALREGRSDQAEERIKKIYNSLRLSNGTQVILNRIRDLTHRDIAEQAQKPLVPGDVNSIIAVTAGNIISTLSLEGIFDNQKVEDGINSAQQITGGNIQVFRDRFSQSFSRSADRLAANIVRDREDLITDPRDRANSQDLGKLCALLVVTGEELPNGQDQELWKYCSNAAYYNVYRDGDSLDAPFAKVQAVQLQKELAGLPVARRICAYHKIRRKWRIAEMYRRLSKPTPPGVTRFEDYLPILSAPGFPVFYGY